MAKEAISVTLSAENITWLKGRAGATRSRSVSETLDELVTAARSAGAGPVRSVVGTIDIDARDADLSKADAGIQALYDRSLARPFVVKESPSKYRGRPRAKKSSRRE